MAPSAVFWRKARDWAAAIALLLAFSFVIFPLLKGEELFYPSVVASAGKLSMKDSEAGAGIYSLEGSWDFYAGALVDPVWLATGSAALPALESIDVPKPMKHGDGNGWLVPQRGTYRLAITGLIPGKSYGLFLGEVPSAYRLFVDGKEIAAQGKVAAESRDYWGRVVPGIGLFRAAGASVDIVLQVADYDSNWGGLWQKVYFGGSERITSLFVHLGNRDLFFLASLVMMTVFQWILFMVMKRDKATLFLALFCTAIVIKSSLSGMMFGYQWFPELGYRQGIGLAYLAMTALAPVFLGYMAHCYPDEVWPPAVKVSIVLAAIQAVIIVASPMAFFESTFVFYLAILLASGLLAFAWGIRAVLRHRVGAALFVLGFAAFFAAGVNDFLFYVLIIKTGYFLNLGLYFFILAQSAITAIRFRTALVKVEELSQDLEGKVEARTRELAEERNALERLAREDSLTGLYNKRYLNQVLDAEFEAYRRYGQGFSFMMIDLDLFKKVNDSHGHLCGDGLLAQLGSTLSASLRKTDVCGRFGGEEFLVVMRSTGLAEAIHAAENLRAAIEGTEYIACGVGLKITVSIGVAESDPQMADEGALVHKADEALYIAKSEGRNRVRTA